MFWVMLMFLVGNAPMHLIFSVVLFCYAIADSSASGVTNSSHVGSRGLVAGVPYSGGENSTEWSFVAIIILPRLSCDSLDNLIRLFDSVLRRENPFAGDIDSKAVRIGGDVCVDGRCFCDGSVDGVLEVVTLSNMAELFQPSGIDFPFEFEMRSEPPSPLRKSVILGDMFSEAGD
jgi:hypothetical protein